MSYSNIALTQIDAKDQLYYLDHLHDSALKWNGSQPLHNPIWLHEKRPSVFRIVDGFMVFDLANTYSPHDPLPARIFPESSSLTQLWELRAQKRALENNLSTIAYLRGLARIMDKVGLTFYPGDMEPAFLLPEIRQNVFSLKILQNLIHKSRHYENFTEIHQLGYNEINQLNNKSDSDLKAFDTLFMQMRLKGKKLTSMIQLIDELGRGYDIQLHDILKNTELETIRTNFPVHQRYRYIKAHLLTLRFPELNKLQAQWDKAVKSIGLDGLVDIEHDPYFENDQLNFVFSAHNAVELKKQLQQMLNKFDSSELELLFDFI